MFGTCVKCGFTKELAKRLEFCPKCGAFLKPNSNVKGSTSPKGTVLREKYAKSEKEQISVISPDISKTWTKKMKHRRKKGSGQYFKDGSYAV